MLLSYIVTMECHMTIHKLYTARLAVGKINTK